VSVWNGYFCADRVFGQLHFESADDDAGKRNLYPVTLSPINTVAGIETVNYSLVNTINQFREHTENGIYPGMFRLGRFTSIVTINKFYNIEFTGSVP